MGVVQIPDGSCGQEQGREKMTRKITCHSWPGFGRDLDRDKKVSGGYRRLA